jgi:hypothetical protein
VGPDRAVGGTYHLQELALDPQKEVLYALGACSAEFDPTGGIPRRCVSAFDLSEDRVLAPGTVELPADVQGEGRLYVAGDTIYLHQRWAGVLHILDASTLSVRETISDVYGFALDEHNVSALDAPGTGGPYVVTPSGVSRLGEEALGRLVTRTYDDSPVDMAVVGRGVSEDRVYVVADGGVQVFERTDHVRESLSLVATALVEDAQLRGLALDESGGRLYVGSYDGLYALDLATNVLVKTPADVGNVWGLALDPVGQRLYALSSRSSDWFGGTEVVSIDPASGQMRTLYSTRSGQLRDLVYDPARARVLVASSADHALIPIDVGTAEPANVPQDRAAQGGERRVGQRLPLGIEVVEVAVGRGVSAGDRLYVSDSAGWVHVLDRETYTPVGSVYGGRTISLDAANGRLYAGDERMPVVTVFDADTLAVERTLPQPGKPRANPSTGEVVIVNRKFYVYDGANGEAVGELLPRADVLRPIGEPPEGCPGCYYTVAREVVIDAQRGLTATVTYTPWPGKPGPEESIAYDPASGRAYYGLLTGGYVRYSSIALYPDLERLQGRDQPMLYLEGLGGALALDSPAQRLYVARSNMLFVLDSETLNRIGRLYTDGWAPAIAAVDGELGRLYMPRGSRLLVWTRTGGEHPPAFRAEPWVVTNTVASILPSPNYAADGTLLANIDGRLVRSTDRGRSWQRLRGGLPCADVLCPISAYTYSAHGRTVSAAAFSPAYATDRRIFVGIHAGETHGEGVYCSQDGGDTWVSCSDGLYDLRVSRVVPSPDFGRDRTVIAYSRTQRGETVYRSTDAGERWQLVLRQTDFNTPPLPRVAEMYPQSDYPPQFRCDFAGACERSDDGGEIWRPLDTTGVQLDRLVGYALSPQYDHDHTVYFLTESDLYRYEDRNRVWSISTLPIFGQRGFAEHLTDLAAAAANSGGHDLFIGSAAGEFYRLASAELTWREVSSGKAPPAVVPLPTPCALEVDPRLIGAVQVDLQKGLGRLGCATGLGWETGAAFQPFERGAMIWREDQRLIYVLREDGMWADFADTWTPDLREPNLIPPQALYRPVRGFARVWVLDLGGPPSPIGWGTAPEQGYVMVVQPFARGLLLDGAEGEAYALYDDGTWEQL